MTRIMGGTRWGNVGLVAAVAVIGFVLLTSCERPPTAEEYWVSKQERRCWAMHGSRNYDKDTHVFECFRAPIGRMTKMLFTETYR